MTIKLGFSVKVATEQTAIEKMANTCWLDTVHIFYMRSFQKESWQFVRWHFFVWELPMKMGKLQAEFRPPKKVRIGCEY